MGLGGQGATRFCRRMVQCGVEMELTENGVTGAWES